MRHIAILASGNGSNAENLARHFSGRDDAEIAVLLCDRDDAPVVGRMKPFGIETQIVARKDWKDNPAAVLETLAARKTDLIVLAGFLSIINPAIVREYAGRIVNLHPSLLPKFGGKGMWGMNVHRAVIDAGERESGITVHYVSDEVDGGEIIAQFKCEVKPDDTPETLAEKIHRLERCHLPEVVDRLLSQIHD